MAATADAGHQSTPDESAAAHEQNHEHPLEGVMVSEPIDPLPLGDHEHDDEAEQTPDHASEHHHDRESVSDASRAA
jgi:hypothetical protein